MEGGALKRAGLVDLEQQVELEGSQDIAAKIHELSERAEGTNAQVYVAFCGLFSAGKSSLLNTLCDSSLATGAVPTTSEINVIELPGVGGRVMLMDTPGIDSTDSAHQRATLDAMHRADVVAIVMDYQHVESDENLELARALTNQGKRLLLIVNQVDKHLEWELPFEAYRRRVEQTFRDWDIAYEQLYFTSTELPEIHDLARLRDDLTAYGVDAGELQNEGILTSLRDLVRDHVTRTNRAALVQANITLEALGEPIPHDVEEAVRNSDSLAEQLSAALRVIANRQKDLLAQLQDCRDSLVRSIELAQIAPYDTTELGRMYVESLRPEFKVGWFKSEAKTAAERKSRLTRFVADLAEHAEKFLTWPTQASLRQFASNFAASTNAWLADAASLSATVTANLCESVVKEGALVSSQYPYQYVKDVVAVIKRSMTADIHNCIDKWTRDLEHWLDAESADERSRVEVLRQKQQAYDIWQRVQTEMNQQQSDLLQRVTDRLDVWRAP